MAGVDGERSYNGVEGSVKKIFQKPFLLSAHLFRAHQMNALGSELRQNRVEKTEMLLIGQNVNPAGDRGQGLGGVHPVGSDPFNAVPDLPLQPRHSNHEELVEIGTENRKEFHSFEKWNTLVPGFFKNTPVKFQP